MSVSNNNSVMILVSIFIHSFFHRFQISSGEVYASDCVGLIDAEVT